jgi:glycosyltransferase involved in cell wall biosynthesis
MGYHYDSIGFRKGVPKMTPHPIDKETIMNQINLAQTKDCNALPLKISVIMPAYNESRVIYESVLVTADTLKDNDYEIIVVDDGSLDATYTEALRAAQVVNNRPTKGQVKVFRNEPNRGKGQTLKTGCSHATGDLVAFLDADLDLNPCLLWTLYEVMQESEADVVIGSKNHPNSKLFYPWHRKVLSQSYFALIHLLFGLPLHDTQTGIKLFRREVLEQVLPRMRVQRFAYDLELLVGAHRFGYRIAEAPVEVTFQGGKMDLIELARTSANMGMDTLRVFYWASSWKWLSPSKSVRLWMIGLVLGISALSFGVGGLLSRAKVPQFLGDIANIVFLRFLDQPVRDSLLIICGLLLAAFAALQLNKAVLAAFTHPDRGDLAGITHAGRQKTNSLFTEETSTQKAAKTEPAKQRNY